MISCLSVSKNVARVTGDERGLFGTTFARTRALEHRYVKLFARFIDFILRKENQICESKQRLGVADV